MSELSATGAIPPHEVLLWLAGRIDDDLLSWARELIAVGEDDQAVELITATLIADRASLPSMLRDWVVDRSRELNLEPRAEAALAPATDDAQLHIFVGELAPNSGLSEVEARAQSEGLRAALAGVAERHLRAGSWWLAWRLTPAGAAPGPLPHPVILVELEPDAGTSAEVSAYQVAGAVQRCGLSASVEVFDAGATLPEYHQSALRAARSDAPTGPYVNAPLLPDPDSDGEPAVAELDVVAEPAGAQHRLVGESPDALSNGSSNAWSDEWVTGEWSETPVTHDELAGLGDTERALLAQLPEELAAREAGSRQEDGHRASPPQRRGIGEPPGLAG